MIQERTRRRRKTESAILTRLSTEKHAAFKARCAKLGESMQKRIQRFIDKELKEEKKHDEAHRDD